jgi:hypothetical protein
MRVGLGPFSRFARAGQREASGYALERRQRQARDGETLAGTVENGGEGFDKAKAQVGWSGFTLAQDDSGAKRETDAAARATTIGTKEQIVVSCHRLINATGRESVASVVLRSVNP